LICIGRKTHHRQPQPGPGSHHPPGPATLKWWCWSDRKKNFSTEAAADASAHNPAQIPGRSSTSPIALAAGRQRSWIMPQSNQAPGAGRCRSGRSHPGQTGIDGRWTASPSQPARASWKALRSLVRRAQTLAEHLDHPGHSESILAPGGLRLRRRVRRQQATTRRTLVRPLTSLAPLRSGQAPATPGLITMAHLAGQSTSSFFARQTEDRMRRRRSSSI